MTQTVKQNYGHQDFGDSNLPNLIYIEPREKSVASLESKVDLDVHEDQRHQGEDCLKDHTANVSEEDIHPGDPQSCGHCSDNISIVI